MAAGQIRVRGAAELERAFLELRREVLSELRPALRKLAEPVRQLAQDKAVSEISHIGPKWSRMRVGVSAKVVYIAPRSRGSGGSPRPNLGPLLMERAMQPALEEKQEEIFLGMGELVAVSAARNGF